MKLAVFIDADNIPPSQAENIFQELQKLGDPITRRAFGNPTVFAGKDGWKEAVRKFAIESRPQINNVDGKNVADFALVINAMDCLYTGHYDGFVIASSDSDFTSLAMYLRDKDKTVYGFGGDHTPESFQNACTTFFILKRPEPPPAPPKPPVAAVKSGTPGPKKPATTGKKKPTIAGKDAMVFFAIVRNLRALKPNTLALLKQTLTQQRKEQEATKIIKKMQNLKLITVGEDEKITWCSADALKKVEKSMT